MEVYSWAVNEPVLGRSSAFAPVVHDTFSAEQAGRIVRMLGRLCAYSCSEMK
jgi:hypothetical protein